MLKFSQPNIPVNNSGVTVRRSNRTTFTKNEQWTKIGYYETRGTFFTDITGDKKAYAVVLNNGGITVCREN